MSQTGQGSLFYEDEYDALNKGMAATGKTRKDISTSLYPGKKLEDALSLFSRIMSPQSTDMNLKVEQLWKILDETRADDFLYYLCDRYSFNRPTKKSKATFQDEVKEQVGKLQNQMAILLKQITQLERISD